MAQNPHTSSEQQTALMSVKRVAELDGTCERTVRRAIASGRLQAVRVGPFGRMVRITREAHEAYRRTGRSDD